MPDRIIEAQAVISAKDNTGDVFINIARKLGEVGKGAKASAEVERLSKALSQADATAKKIDGFRVASKGLDAASLSMAQAKQRAAQLAEQISGMTKPTATLNGQMTQAERAVVKATDAFKRQGAAVREARTALSEAGVPLNKLGAEQKRLQEVVQGTTRALEAQIGVERRAAEMAEKVAAAARDQAKAEAAAGRVAHQEAERRAEGIRHHGVGNLVAGAAAGVVSAHGVAHLSGEVLQAGSELQRARLASSQAGIPAEEMAHIEQRALDLSTKYGNVSQVGVMELAKELRSVVTHPEELEKVLTPLVQAKSVLDAKDLTGERSHGLNLLVKGAESIGAAQDPERLTRLIDAYVKAIQVMGTTINPDQIFQFDKYSKTAGATMSDRFLMTTGLSLSQEMGGSTAANDLFHAQKDIVGGFQNKHVPLKEMARLGLIDHDDIEFTKTGEAKGIRAGAKGVHDASLAQTDLDLWVYKTFLPALEKHGITGTQAQLAETSKIFTGNEADVISKLITQRSALENHALAFPKASGLSASGQNAQDAAVGLQSLGKAVENLAANVSVTAMAPIGTALSGLAGQIDRLAQAAKDHPEIALGAGAAVGAGALAASGTLAYYVGTGFGLPAAATRLTEAAEAIIVAEKGGHGASGGASPGAPGSPGYSLGSTPWFAALGLGGLALGAPGLDEAGNKTRDANASALGNFGNALGFGSLDALRERMFGPGGDVTTWVSGLLRGGSSGIPLPPARPDGLTLPAIVPPPEVVETFRLLPPAAHGAADALDRMKEREEKLKDDYGLTGFVMGQLDTAAARAAVALASLASYTGGSSGGGAGIISAAYHPGGSGAAATLTPLLRGAQRASLGGSNPYAGGASGSDFVAPGAEATTAGMRQNNLGNLGFFKGMHYAGLLGASGAKDVDHHIARFATQEDGIRAAAALALHKYMGGRHNAWDVIAARGGWTPGPLGPGASVNVARTMGLSNRDDLHLDQPDQMVKFLHGLAVQEHGAAGRYFTEDRIRGALHREHPALSAPPLRPRQEQGGSTSAHIEEAVRKVIARVEVDVKTRHEVTAGKGLQVAQTYHSRFQRGDTGHRHVEEWR